MAAQRPLQEFMPWLSWYYTIRHSSSFLCLKFSFLYPECHGSVCSRKHFAKIQARPSASFYSCQLDFSGSCTVFHDCRYGSYNIYTERRKRREIVSGLIHSDCFAGWVGNVVYNPENIKYFSMYFVVALSVVMIMIARIRLLKIVLFFLATTPLDKYLGKWIRAQVKKINKQYVVFFTKTDDLELLNKAVLYVRENELTDRMKIIHVYKEESQIPEKLVRHVEILDEMYPKLRLDLVTVHAEGFTPRVVKQLATKLNIEQNFMFISCPGENFPAKIAKYGGMRIITH